MASYGKMRSRVEGREVDMLGPGMDEYPQDPRPAKHKNIKVSGGGKQINDHHGPMPNYPGKVK